MSTIAELLVKIGADNSGLKKSLTDSQSSIKTAFSSNPVNEFTNALEGTTNGVGSLIGKFSSLAAVAAGGFGFTALIDNAVKAGNSAYEMSQRLGVSSQDAVNLSRVLSMSGTDVGTFNSAIMRLDKSFSKSGESGQLCRDTLAATGVTLTDANGKLLPVTEQLANLAQGYDKAKQSGEQQAFLMNTLGVKGLQLTKVFEDYNEKMKIASGIKGIGLNPEEMHKLSLEMDATKMQASQLGLVFGSALTPIAQELFPPILAGLQTASVYLAQNKSGVIGVTEEALKLYAAYKLANMAQSAISTVKKVAQGFTGSNTGEKAAASELSDFQQKMIDKSVAASERGYMRKINAAVKSAQAESVSADEAAAQIAIAMERITAESEAASFAIRERMTAAFSGAAVSAEESAAVINTAIASTGTVATEAAGVKTAVTTESAAACTAAVVESSTAQVEAIASTGVAAEEAAIAKTTATVESAEVCTATVVESSVAQEGSIVAVGTAAEVTGAQQVAASESAVIAADEVVAAEERVAGAEIIAGDEAIASGAKMETASKGAAVQVGVLSGAVNLLRANWILVAYATYEALSWLIKYANERNKVKSYNPNAEVFKGDDGKYYKKRKYEGEQQYDTMTGQPIDNTNNYEYAELSPEELEAQNNYENPPEFTPPKMPDLNLPSAGSGKESGGRASTPKESAEEKTADKARQKEISEANKFAEQLNKDWSAMYETKSDISKAAYDQELANLETWHNDGLVSDEDYNADLLKMSQVRTTNLIEEQQKQLDAERGYQKSAIDLVRKLQDLKDDNLTGSAAAAATFQKEWDKALQDVKDKVDDIVSKLNSMKEPAERNKAIRGLQDKGMMGQGDFAGKAVTASDLTSFSQPATAAVNAKYTQEQQDTEYDRWKKQLDEEYNHGNVQSYQQMLNDKQNLDHRYLASQQASMDELKDLWTKTHRTSLDEMAEASQTFDSGLTSIFTDIGKGIHGAGDLIKSFGSLVLETILKIQAEKLAANITTSIFGTALSGVSKASGINTSYVPDVGNSLTTPITSLLAGGGLLSGPGTGTSDSIFMRGSNGEFMVQESAVRSIGVANLDYMNTTGKLPGYATGGLVTGPSLASLSGSYGGAVSSGGGQANSAPNIQLNVTNNTGSEVTAQNTSASFDGQKYVIDIVLDAASRNVSGFGRNLKTALGGI